METRIIACKIIQDELLKVMQEAGLDFPAVFLKPGLDDRPEELKAQIMAELDKIAEPSRVILGYGFSNGAISELPAGKHQLAAPLAEDAICILLGSGHRRDEIMKEGSSYFITRGWLRGDNLFKVFNQSVEKYGETKAIKMQKRVMDGYKHFMLIDTGAYDLNEYRQPLTELGEKLGLGVAETKVGLEWLKALVAGPPWNNKFAVAEPGGSLTIDAQSLL